MSALRLFAYKLSAKTQLDFNLDLKGIFQAFLNIEVLYLSTPDLYLGFFELKGPFLKKILN